MASTTDVFEMLAKNAQKALHSSINAKTQLEQQKKLIGANVERTEAYAPRTKDPNLMQNLLLQRSLSLGMMQHVNNKQNEVSTKVERDWQMLRQQHQRKRITHEKALAKQRTLEARNAQQETDEYNLGINSIFGNTK